MKKPELLLPVGDYQSCLAAIHNGADAIYMGVPHFNARGRSKDHTLDEIKEIIDLCHLYGVEVHLAFNVLIFEDELEIAQQLLKELVALSPDAFIVQDLGLVKLIKEIAPEQVVHASTQMTVTNQKAIELLDDLDIDRFVLGRENSIEDIKKIKTDTNKELEVFVHGALCVAYSGQCFTSESIGGRSANRGQCAQSCRFEYKMLVDGIEKNLNNRPYIVSPKDLDAIEYVPELAQIGVDSFKIEGRLKGPEYVASTAHFYRQKIDGDHVDTRAAQNQMALTYSRGFFPGWMNGVDHQRLVDGRYSAHRGIEIGKIIEVNQKGIIISSSHELTPGMGVLFARGQKEWGSNLYQAYKLDNQRYKIGVDNKLDLSLLNTGDLVFLNSSQEASKNWEKSLTDKNRHKKIAIDLELIANVGEKLVLRFKSDGDWISISNDQILEEAKKPVQVELIQKELTALSGTIYQAREVEIKTGQAFIPQKEIKQLRQRMSEILNQTRIFRPEININEIEISSLRDSAHPSDSRAKLSLLLRNKQQVIDVVNANLEELDFIYLDFEFGKDYAPSIELLKNANIKCAVATTRILKPGEYHHLNHIIRLNPDAILVRNLGAIQYLKENAPDIVLHGDYSLNIANSLTAKYLIAKGLTVITPGLDLNQEQLESLLSNTNTSKVQVIIHQYMPSFHMEHCVFAAFLSKGSSFKDCGKPCEQHHLELIDQFGNAHYIKADQECRNTMFNAKSQTSVSMYDNLLEKGVFSYRFEALDEVSNVLIRKIKTYLELINGQQDHLEIASQVGALEKYGIGSGQLFGKDLYMSRKK